MADIVTIADRAQVVWSCLRIATPPGFGDPDALSLAVTLAYFAAALLAAGVALRGPFRNGSPGRERWLWGIAAAILALLALNKQLDLQTFITATGRCIARVEGWYQHRRTVQAEATLVLVLLAALGVPMLLLALRRVLRGNLLLVGGMVLLIIFVLIRMISFHHMDVLMRTRVLTLPAHRLIEALALALVLFAAVRRLAGR